ncbi:MAG: hypothetical protein DRN35_06565 [Thermoplasmata archaeon]|nr:MAG: hypothetical protein DRN35_06565 [Thermoplasmata archaeon]RLF71788.1 MAG: hypothetical protein DRN40_01750 [Thermoplasmata archaeon]
MPSPPFIYWTEILIYTRSIGVPRAPRSSPPPLIASCREVPDLVKIPPSHPRYRSLMERERLVEAFRKGLVAPEGLLAHGRGEAFDYILGEHTMEVAEEATVAAAAALLIAKWPVISMNGNATALASREAVELSHLIPARIEVNLFYRSEERVRKLVKRLQEEGARGVLGERPDRKIEGLDHPRALCCTEGIYTADWVLLSLEDGDRTEALARWGKKIVAVDLNPLSRTARAATVTIVDNITRAFPNLVKKVEGLKEKLERGEVTREDLEEMVRRWDNNEALARAVEEIIRYLEREVESWRGLR